MAYEEKNFTEENLHVLYELKKLSSQKRQFIITNGGPGLIFTFSEIFWNFVHNSTKDNLKDISSIKIIKKYNSEIGILINSYTSLKKKRNILLNNSPLVKLALTIGLSGYEYYRQSFDQNESK